MSRFKPIPFRPIAYFLAGGHQRRFVVFWLLLCLLVIPSGMLTRIFELTGIPINLFGLQLHLTVYIPLLICVPMCLILGYYWAAIPAYFSTFLVAMLGDMPIYWIVVFALANPIGLAMLVMMYKVVPANINLRSLPAILFYLVASFLFALSGSIGSFIWTYSNQVGLHDFIMVWQGWWLGGFLQAVFICGPILYFFADKLLALRHRYIPDSEHKPENWRSIKLLITLITLILILFTWLALKVSMLNIQNLASEIADSNTREQLIKAIQVVDVPIVIYVCILAFIGYFSFYFIDFWTMRLARANQALHKKNEKLYQLSIKDHLTKIYNRSYLYGEIPEIKQTLQAENGTLTVMLIDLDHFKRVNDNYGHQAGDRVLREFSEQVQNIVQAEQIFARLGGEEFILVAPRLEHNDALKLANDINQATKTITIRGQIPEHQLTASLGVYVTKDLNQTLDQMIAHADKALYQAKSNGRDRVVMVTDKDT